MKRGLCQLHHAEVLARCQQFVNPFSGIFPTDTLRGREEAGAFALRNTETVLVIPHGI